MTRLALGLWALAACSRGEPPARVASREPTPEVATRKPMLLELGKPAPIGGDIGTTIELGNYVIEAIAPGPSKAYPGGAGTTLHFTVAGESLSLSELPAGYESRRVGWTSRYRVELAESVDGKPPTARVFVDEIGRDPVPGSTRTAAVERGKTVDLGDGITLRFTGHGHKMVAAGDPPSPLIVSVEYLEGTGLEEKSYNLDLPEERVWRWRDRWFRLAEHQYDASMVLEIGRLPLASR